MIGEEVGLRNVVEDLTPQLGGNLDVSGKEIVSVSNGDIVINTDGTGITQILSELDMGDNSITDVAYADFNLTNGTAAAEGRLVWNPDEGTLNLGMKGGGAVCNSAAIELTLHIPSIYGGAIAGGLADVTFDDQIFMIGGVVVGGGATEKPIFTVVVSTTYRVIGSQS